MKPMNGFTLFELLIALAIAGILFGIGAPSYSQLHAKIQARALKHNIQQFLVAGRHYSVAERMDVTVCGINESEECTPENFKSIAIFVDNNVNQSIDYGEQIFAIRALKYDGLLHLNASLNRDYIRFTRTGSSQVSGSFIYCHPQYPHAAARVTVSMPGRTYIGQDLDHDGVAETASGERISC